MDMDQLLKEVTEEAKAITTEDDTLRTELDALKKAAKAIADTNYTFIEGKCEVTYQQIRSLRTALASLLEKESPNGGEKGEQDDGN